MPLLLFPLIYVSILNKLAFSDVLVLVWIFPRYWNGVNSKENLYKIVDEQW